MNNTTPPKRWATSSEGTDTLLCMLNLQDNEWLGSQDWELMLADPTRVAEFCDLYESDSIDNDMRILLMELIIYSLDDEYREMTSGSVPTALAARVERLLRSNFIRHFYVIRYWCCADLLPPDDQNPEYIFPVTPMMQRIWKDCLKPDHQPWIDLVEGA